MPLALAACPRRDAGERVAPDPAANGSASSRSSAVHLPLDREGIVGTIRQASERDDSAPSAYCLDDGKLWRGLPHRVASVAIADLDDAQLAPLAGRTALVLGALRDSLDAIVKEEGPCPPEFGSLVYQARSDWFAPEGGTRTSHTRLAATRYLSAAQAVPVSLITFSECDARACTAAVGNPFDAPLRDLEVRVHYETGPGKPMPRRDVFPLELPVGASRAFPELLRHGGGSKREKRGTELWSVEIVGKIGGVRFDVSVPAPP